MPPKIDFAIAIWQSNNPDLYPSSEIGWRWTVSIYQTGWKSRRVYKEGCENTLYEAAILAQAAVRNYGQEN